MAAPQTPPGAPAVHRLFAASPAPMLVVAPDPPRFTVLDANDAYLAAISTTREKLVGRGIFEAFPDDPGAADLRASLERALASRRPDRMPVQRWTVPRPEGGFEERWWDPVNAPVLAGDGAVEALIHHVADATARERAAAALRESEEFNRRVLRASADCIKVLDLDGRLEFMSEGGMCVMEVEDFGAVRGACWPDFWRGEDRAKALAAVEEAKRGGTGRFQGPAPTLKGSPRWWDVVVTPIAGPDGRPEKILSISRDVSATKRAEEALRESEDHHRHTVELNPQVPWTCDPRGRVTSYSNRWLEITGQAPGEPLGDGWIGALHPDDAPGTLERFSASLASGEPLDVEYRVRVAATGGHRWARARAFPRRDERGAIVRWYGVVEDVHDRKLAEADLRELNETLEQRVAARTAELAESRRRFRAVFDSALQFMALLTPDGTVVEVNRTALNWSRIEPADIVGRPFWLAAPMRDNPALQAAVEAGVRRAAAGETVREEHEMRGAGDARATVDFSLKPAPGGRGEAAWLVAEGRDITELKQAQEQLRQAQKMEAVGRLTGGVAHDFNNLLTPIVGSLDMLQRKGLGGEREQRLIAGAMQSAERAKTLVQRLLAFARRQPLQPVPVDIAELVTGMGELVSSTTGPQIKVVVEVARHLPPAEADPNQLEMALLNLAVNARDAMPDGGTLRITATAEAVGTGHRSKLGPGRYVRLSVADTGTGMDEATMARAVEPFFSTKGVGKGTGLGLSMVHGLASQLGGALTIRSRPGLGTDVELWLPQSASVPERATAPPAASPAPAARGTALLVDDEELVRMSTADMLGDLGYSVLEASSGEEALRLLGRGEPFDLLVTDHLMPGMTGTELARAVRTERPGVSILLVSGYAEQEGIEPGLPRLTKPFRKDELAASLARLFG